MMGSLQSLDLSQHVGPLVLLLVCGQLWAPFAVTVDPGNGDVYVMSTNNFRVEVRDPLRPPTWFG
jgi:hypothetical protein